MTDNKTVTPHQAREALDDLDDYARMEKGINAYGPRGVLERFIEQSERERDQLSAHLERLREAIYQARDQVANSPIGCLGDGYTQDGEPYPIRDEIVHRFTQALDETPAQALIEHDIKVTKAAFAEIIKSVNIIYKPHIAGVCAVLINRLRTTNKSGGGDNG